jgi:tetratricopeptide (TPR) repeat protein
MSASLKAARAAPMLRGVVVRGRSPIAVLVLCVSIASLGGLTLALLAPTNPVLPLAALLVAAVPVLLWAARLSRLGSISGRAQLAVLERRWEDAERELREIVDRIPGDEPTTYALHALGMVAMRRGDERQAVVLLRAALDLQRAAWFAGELQRRLPVAADLALALAMYGDLDEAERSLGDGHGSDDPRFVRSRLVVLARRGRLAEALSLLGEDAWLFRDALFGDDVAIVEVVREMALATRAEYRLKATAPRTIPVDPDLREHILRVLPGTETLLGSESWAP